MTRTVPLAELPAGLRFPIELSTRISFDPAAHQLQFQGFMSKTDFDKLVRLSNDLAYQRALEQLFQICTYPAVTTADTPRRWPWLAIGLAGGAMIAVVTVWAVMFR